MISLLGKSLKNTLGNIPLNRKVVYLPSTSFRDKLNYNLTNNNSFFFKNISYRDKLETKLFNNVTISKIISYKDKLYYKELI